MAVLREAAAARLDAVTQKGESDVEEDAPRRGDIFMADLARDPLSRKSGKRPVIIVQNDMGNANSGSVIAVIVTGSHKKKLPTHVPLYPRHGSGSPAQLCVSTLSRLIRRAS